MLVISNFLPSAEKFVAEEVERTDEDDPRVVARLQGGDEERVLSDGVRELLDLLVGVEGISGGRGRQHGQNQRILRVGRHSDSAVEIFVRSHGVA